MYIGNELKNDAEQLKQRINSVKIEAEERASFFMFAPDQLKEAFVKLYAGSWEHCNIIISQSLHWYRPRFLE